MEKDKKSENNSSRGAHGHKSAITINHHPERGYDIWPDNNLYLRIGLYENIANKYYNHLSCKLTFVDFSHYNIKRFTSSEWIHRLTAGGARLILLSDRRMDNFASYWWKNSENIATVIYSNDREEIINNKIKDVFIGRWRRDIRSRSLTHLEADVLNLLIKEYSVKDIATSLNLDKRKFYNTKYSLQKKLSGDINKLFISCSMN